MLYDQKEQKSAYRIALDRISPFHSHITLRGWMRRLGPIPKKMEKVRVIDIKGMHDILTLVIPDGRTFTFSINERGLDIKSSIVWPKHLPKAFLEKMESMQSGWKTQYCFWHNIDTKPKSAHHKIARLSPPKDQKHHTYLIPNLSNVWVKTPTYSLHLYVMAGDEILMKICDTQNFDISDHTGIKANGIYVNYMPDKVQQANDLSHTLIPKHYERAIRFQDHRELFEGLYYFLLSFFQRKRH